MNYHQEKARRIRFHDAVRAAWFVRPVNDWSKQPVMRLPLMKLQSSPSVAFDPNAALVDNSLPEAEARHFFTVFCGVTLHVIKVTSTMYPEYLWVPVSWTDEPSVDPAYVLQIGDQETRRELRKLGSEY
jgi:hypothetical protein